MFEQSVDEVLKRCKFKRRATANGWSVETAARVPRDFWRQIERCFPNEDDPVAQHPAKVTRKDLLTLQDGQWVSDAVIACCTGLTCISSKDGLLSQPADSRNPPPRVLFCDPLMLQKIEQARQEVDSSGNSADDLLSMARWSKKCDVGAVLQAQQIFVPAHVGSNHWLAAIVHVRERRLEILDSAPSAATGNESAGGSNSAATGGQFKINAEDVPDAIIWWLKFMQAQVQVEAGGGTGEWAIERCEYAPRQADGFNCGIYTIANAVATALGEEDCGEIDPGAWRKWLACEIVAQGCREGTHDEVDLLPGGKSWKGWLGAEGNSEK